MLDIAVPTAPATEPPVQAPPPAGPGATMPPVPPADPGSGIAPARPLRRHWRRWLALALLLAGGAGLAIHGLAPPRLAVIQATRGTAVQAAYATGTVEATVMVPIAARTAARLVRLDADEGDQVRQGQLLAQLEDDDLRRTIDEAQAEERYARAELERQAALVQRSVVSRTAFDRAHADWVKARAAADRAAVQAGFLQLVAPADGRIIRRDGEVGQLIGANQTVFWMSCCAPLRVAAEVDEEDIARVQPGQKVLLRADAFPGQVFEGTVQAVTPKGDPVARSYRVRITLPADTRLMIGMTAETNIILHTDPHALLLPATALVQDAVWLVRDGHLQRRRLTIGARTPDAVEVLDGLAESDRVVVRPSAALAEGQAVRPVAEPTR
jgi:RND family efflux transporter MFP subunit